MIFRIIGELVIIALVTIGAGTVLAMCLDPKLRRQTVSTVKGWFK